MIISNRKFGVEIEMFGLSARKILEIFNRLNISCLYEDYNHETRIHWKLTTDSSIRNNNGEGDNCYELVSPVLFGESGLRQINAITEALCKAGAKVNRTCGLHVHVNAQDYDSVDLANIIMRYSHFESKIDEFMPQSRKGSNNNYCLSVKEIETNINRNIAKIFSWAPDEVVRCADSRYYKLNILAYLRHGTVEFRQHSGTIDGPKICNWIKFCVNFVENSRLPETSFQEKEISVDENEAGGCNCGDCRSQNPKKIKKNTIPLTREIIKVIDAINYLIENSINGRAYSDAQLGSAAGLDPRNVHRIMEDIMYAFEVSSSEAVFDYTVNKWYFSRYLKFDTSSTKDENKPPKIVKIKIPVFDFQNDSITKGLDQETISYFDERMQELLSVEQAELSQSTISPQQYANYGRNDSTAIFTFNVPTRTDNNF